MGDLDLEKRSHPGNSPATAAQGAGATLEDLAGPDAELWELGVVVTEPGAAP